MLTAKDLENIGHLIVEKTKPEFDKLGEKIDDLERRTSEGFKRTEQRFDYFETKLKDYVDTKIESVLATN